MAITIEHLKTKTYEQAENWYRQGIISQELWEEYCNLWRNSTPRYSGLAGQYEDAQERFQVKSDE